MRVLLILILLAVPALAQEPTPDADNPLAALNEQLKAVLAGAQVPFDDDQERSIALMMEERRRASEDLFGDLMNFRSGPTSGQEADRLRSAIEWLRNEYIRLLGFHLTAEQSTVWERHLATAAAAASSAATAAGERPPGAAPRSQTQYVRINNNAFTAEDLSFAGGGGGNFNGGGGGGGGGGQGTEVIQRGGVGAWHGNAQLLLKDDALNARNAFAGNKPPYQERRLSVDVSGPTIPGTLTSSVAFNQTESENVDTIRATLPEGIFALGITKPNTFRQINSRSTYQLADAHSLRVFVRYATEVSRDQGIGGFTLPERASGEDRSQWNAEISNFSSLSSRSIFEARLQISRNHSVTTPASEAVKINVLDAFNRGGAQNRSDDRQNQSQFSTLYTRFGEALTIKTGMEGAYRVNRTTSTSNFGGTFTFSSLDGFLAGTPNTYRVTRGSSVLETRQLEMSAFVQSDWRLNRQFMLMLGARYDAQTNLADRNNLSPRASIAYSPGQAFVIRSGGGLFYNRLNMGMVETQRRLDGTRQYEIVIDYPSYPDPFAAGTIRQTFPSVRVTDPDLDATYVAVGMVSVERTFLQNLLVTATYDYQREYGRLRTRDLNAPYDSTAAVRQSCAAGLAATDCVRPDPTRGNVINLESTGREVRHRLRLNARKRFSIFNASANYQVQHALGDVQGNVGAAATDSYNPGIDWGRAPFPMHQFSSSLNARLPLGVFLTSAVSAQSGRRYTMTTGMDDNRDGSATDRPSGVRPNSLVGPHYVNADFNISKAFFLRGDGGGTNVNVFVNLTNAFNHVHYGTPSGVMTSPNFGRSTSASDPREIEVGFRFQF